MAGFTWDAVGTGISNVVVGATGLIKGIGDQTQAAAEGTRAAAANVAANEASEQAILQANAAREQQTLFLAAFAIILAIGLPIAAIVATQK